MNQSQSRMFRYAVAEVCVLALLIFVCRVALREPPVDKSEHPATVATAPPRVREATPLFPPADDSSAEAKVNRLNESATTNAAAIYRQAFALYDALSNEQKEVVSNWRTNVDASVEAELCEKIQPICELMHQASVLTNCDWGLKRPITFVTPLPHLSQCRNIARAAVWNATHCRTDEPTRAVDDLVATSRLGQIMSPGIIGHLVDLAIQNNVIEAVAEHASILANASDPRLEQLFTDAYCEEGLYRGIEQEGDMISALADEWAAMPPEEFAREMKSLKNDDPKWQSLDPAQVLAAWRQVADLEREHASVLGATDAEYREWLARLQAVRETNPFVESFLPNFDPVTDRTQVVIVRSAMVAAGLAVMQSGTGALQSHPDPVTGQQFTYTHTANGFELQSGYQFNCQPLKLSFK
jgi:hypothetical protein